MARGLRFGIPPPKAQPRRGGGQDMVACSGEKARRGQNQDKYRRAAPKGRVQTLWDYLVLPAHNLPASLLPPSPQWLVNSRFLQCPD